jgi:opacity protein-like surface antigen
MSLDRVLTLIVAAALMSGCHWFSKLTPDCHTPQEYQRAGQIAPLKVPAGLDSPNTQGALVIPTVAVTPPPPGPNDLCLDVPPRYVPAPSNKAGISATAATVDTAAAATAANSSAVAVGPAPAAVTGPLQGDWEFRIGPTFGLSQDVDFSNGSAQIKDTTGLKLGAAYYLTEHLSFGGYFSYSHGDFSSEVINSGVKVGVQDGHETSSTLLFDTSYSFLHGPLRPYVEGGLGYSWVDTNIASGAPVAGCWWDPWWGYVCSGYQPTHGTSSAVGQLGAGLQYNFNHEFGIAKPQTSAPSKSCSTGASWAISLLTQAPAI